MATSKTTFQHNKRTYMFLTDGKAITIASAKRGEKVTFKHIGSKDRRYCSYTRCGYQVAGSDDLMMLVEGEYWLLIKSQGRTYGQGMHLATEDEITSLATDAARRNTASTEGMSYEETTCLRAFALLRNLVPMTGSIDDEACVQAAIHALSGTLVDNESGDVTVASETSDDVEPIMANYVINIPVMATVTETISTYVYETVEASSREEAEETVERLLSSGSLDYLDRIREKVGSDGVTITCIGEPVAEGTVNASATLTAKDVRNYTGEPRCAYDLVCREMVTHRVRVFASSDEEAYELARDVLETGRDTCGIVSVDTKVDARVWE